MNRELEMALAQSEWLAWRQLCKQLKAAGIEVDAKTSTPLILAIKFWGEEVAALRSEQEGATVTDAATEARHNYRPHVLDDGAP
jgi:hypothetical protein